MMSVKSEMLGARDEFISLVRNELLGPRLRGFRSRCGT